MSGTDLAASLTASLAWPVVLLVLLLVFRAQVGGLLAALRERMQDLTEATGPGNVSVKFEKVLKRVEDDLEGNETDPSLPPPHPEGGLHARGDRDVSIRLDTLTPLWQDPRRLGRIADVSPRGAFLALYSELEEEIASLAASSIEPGQHWAGSSMRGWKRLVNEGVIPHDLGRALSELQELRNISAHARESSLPAAALLSSLNAVTEAIGSIRIITEGYARKWRELDKESESALG